MLLATKALELRKDAQITSFISFRRRKNQRLLICLHDGYVIISLFYDNYRIVINIIRQQLEDFLNKKTEIISDKKVLRGRISFSKEI